MDIEDFNADIEMQWDSFNKHLAEYGGESEDVVWLNWNSFKDVACYFYKLGKQSKEKENANSFTGLKTKIIGYCTTPNELDEIESSDVIVLAANNVIYTDYITLYPVWTIAHKQEEVLKEVEEFKKRKSDNG